MNTVAFRLQERDRSLLHFLREQGVATFEQIERRFFPDKHSCSKRLSKLVTTGYLDRLPITTIFPKPSPSLAGKRYFPFQLGVGVHPGTLLYRLSDAYMSQVNYTKKLVKPTLVLHQLILNDVREALEKDLAGASVFNDPNLTILSDIDFDRRKEFTPDLSFECSDYRMAVELERTSKSMSRYLMRFTHYDDSAYSHVLYIYVKESHEKILRECAGTARKIAFAHYLRPTEVLSNTWGHLSLTEFISKVNHIRTRR